MCGIAGILGELTEANHAALQRMNSALVHRGPDSGGCWTSAPDQAGRGCMLAHRRLSIIDLSRAADQPMTDDTQGITRAIVFNGEIYNFKDLRRGLEQRGERFASTGDTAVMLRLLAISGPDAVRQLRGMFAFALWDDGARELVLARDPLGMKPLYVCRNADRHGRWSLLFASEVRAILASGLIHPRLNRRALASTIWNGFVLSPETIVEGIESLRPGELRVVQSTGETKQSQRYWRMPSGMRKGEIDEEELRAAVAESVRLHMVSDVPIGVFLSGGIDSSAVANLAQQTSSDPIHTFTLAFEEQQYDEGRYARKIARAIGTNHHEITLTEHQFAGAVHTALDTLDQPTFDGLNSYYISKAVREAGLTVALVGTGGDELFGGYPSFRILPTLLRWAVVDRVLPAAVRIAIARAGARLLGAPRRAFPPQTKWAKLPAMIQAQRDPVALYQLAYALFLPDFQAELLADADLVRERPSGLSAEWVQTLAAEAEGHSPLSAVSIFEQRLFLGERLLRDTDAASMAVSLETRLPLVDSVVTETVNRLSDDRRYMPLGRKSILREIGLSGLDPALFDRPKSGFVLPFDRWIRRSLGAAMDETMLDRSLARALGMDGDTVARLWAAYQGGAPGLYWSRVWILFVLIRWCHHHRVLL
jgi:asparagine synthase (glutamine-hydrolysing)